MTIEEAKVKILELEDTIKTLTNDNENFKTQFEEKEKRVKELEEYNQKLFLRATATQKEEKKEEKFTSKLIGEYAELLSDEELEILKELEEEL